MTTKERLSDLIGAIYDCVIEPEKWSDTMAVICHEIHCSHSGIVVFDLEGSRPRFLKQWNFDPYWEQRLSDFFGDMTQLYKSAPNLSARSIDEPLVLSRDVPKEIWTNTRLYQEWAKPQGLCDTLQAMVLRASGRIGVFAGHRHESQGNATDKDIETLRLLAPHIRRAVTISDLMDLKALERQALTATLDLIATGVVVVADENRILHANQAARQMLARGEPLRSVNGRLSARDASADDELAKAISVARRDEAEIGAAGIGVAIAGQFREPAIAHVLPLARGDVRSRLVPRATAAVFITRAASAPVIGIGAIAGSIGLTPAEARLLEKLASGTTLPNAAAALGIAETTAKTHLTHLFSKTGVSRQADLITFVHRLMPPVVRPTAGKGGR